jgi:hypothetical protein
MYNLTLRCVRVTIGAVEKQYVLHTLNVSVFSRLFCGVLCCHLWPVWLYDILPHYLINGTIFGKKVIEYKLCVFFFIFATNFVWNISHYEKNSSRYDHKCTWVFMWSTRYSCQILIKIAFSWQIFEKYSNINFMEVRPVRARVVPCGRADRQTDMANLVLTFRNFANSPKKDRHEKLLRCMIKVITTTTMKFGLPDGTSGWEN